MTSDRSVSVNPASPATIGVSRPVAPSVARAAYSHLCRGSLSKIYSVICFKVVS